MDRFGALLACPACTGQLTVTLTTRWTCLMCGAAYDAPDGIPILRSPDATDARTEAVRQFYERSPFPGYPPRETLHALRARAARNSFVRLLDDAIAGDARIVDVGCGTGQMCLYLARADRLVLGVDMTRASLQLGAGAAARFGLLDRVRFVETDLRRPGLRAGVFDVVFSSGVLHHTPDPRAAFARLVQLARPDGGIIIVGLYNAFARVPLRLRRVVARLSRFRFIPFDPILRDRQHEPARREAWVRDQYQHPEEHRHTLAEVQGWFAQHDVEYLRAYPSALLAEDEDEDENEDAAEAESLQRRERTLFTHASDNWRLEGWLAQLGWMRTLGREGGLFFTLGRRGPRR